VFAVLSEEVQAHEGLNVSCAAIDELHVHRNSSLLDTLWYGGDAREQPLFFMITTAGEYDEESIGWQTHEYARQVIDGTFDNTEYYAVIYAADKDDDLYDPEVQRRCNPSMGYTITEQAVRAALVEAKHDPHKLAKLMRYRFNIWVQSEDAYYDVAEFKECVQPFTLADMRGRACVGAMDLSSSDDTTAVALCFPPSGGDEFWRFLEWYWIPEETQPERAERNQQPYRYWVDRGFMEVTPGPVVDLRIIRSRIVEITRNVAVQNWLYDPHRATEIVQYLQDDGLKVEPFGQSAINYNAPMERFKEMISRREIAHVGNPVTVWQLGNVIAKANADGYIRPMKQNPTVGKANRARKIDGPQCMLMSLGKAMGDGVKESVYNRRGMIRL